MYKFFLKIAFSQPIIIMKTFYPIFESQKRFFKELFSQNSDLMYRAVATSKKVVETTVKNNQFRDATGVARSPKPDKTPIMAARRRCLLFFKIKVRPGSCRSYHIWRPCNWLYPPAQAPTPKIMLLF